MSFRNPSPPLNYDVEAVSKPITNVLPIIVKLLDNVMSGNIDGQNIESIEDTPLERSLCAVWDLAGIEEYAVVMVENNLPIVILKICTSTRRARTRELAIGTLANIASHQETYSWLLDEDDVLMLINSVLWSENDARVLHEATRLLEGFLSWSINVSEQTVVETSNLTNLFATELDSPSFMSRYIFIVTNSLNTDLLIRALAVIRYMVVYMYSTNILFTTPGLKSQAKQLVSWATERLEEEGRGIGIGGFNKTVAKNLMHVVWAIGAYKILLPQEYDERTANSLKESMKRIQSYIDEEYDISQEDEAIHDLAERLSSSLAIAG
ncbi:hypothetical protein NQZ79_g8915 [Umbelopsis isabellina]|nr:hypothetical protein NQZ79_g8915 [Umbelopsis isabellina]